jgi:hypothetical protein
MSKDKTVENVLPLFEYAKKFEDFETYESFDSYLIYCFHTCGIPKKEIAQTMLLSEAGFHCGFGEMRPFAPKSSGTHGMFEVVRK